MSVLIRKANNYDIDYLLTQLELFAKEVPYKKDLFSSSVEWKMKSLICLMEKHLFLIAEKNGLKSGFIAGLVTPHFLNPNLISVTELFWWVNIEMRGSSVGARLLQSYTEEAKKIGDWVSMHTQTSTKIKDSSLERLGYKFSEKSFVMEVL